MMWMIPNWPLPTSHAGAAHLPQQQAQGSWEDGQWVGGIGVVEREIAPLQVKTAS